MTHKEDIKRLKEMINNKKVIQWFNDFADSDQTEFNNILKRLLGRVNIGLVDTTERKICTAVIGE